MSRRGQSASQAAVTIVIITLLLILYILFLSPEDRARLLDDDDLPGQGAIPGSRLVFRQAIGFIAPVDDAPARNALPAVQLFSTLNTRELQRIASASVRHSSFGEQPFSIGFSIPPNGTEQVLLSFNVREARGQLNIHLNGDLIHSAEHSVGSPAPITLPIAYLRRGANNITFTTGSPGLRFWSANRYELSNLLIAAEVRDASTSRAQQHFALERADLASLERAELEAYATCQRPGTLRVSLNDQVVYAGLPECEALMRFDLPSTLLRHGDNVISYRLDSGAVTLERLGVVLHTADTPRRASFFTIEEPLYDAMLVGQHQLMLTLRFAEVGKRKVGTINLNGYQETFDTYDMVYQTPIAPQYVSDGSNSIQLLPQQAMAVSELRIEIV